MTEPESRPKPPAEQPLAPVPANAEAPPRGWSFRGWAPGPWSAAPTPPAVRLGIAGTHQAQRLQHILAPAMDAVLDRCAGLREDELAQTVPIADLIGSMHDRLYSRLFQS